MLGIVKVDKCSHLSNQSLDDFLILKSSSTPLATFNAGPSIDLWWSAKGRIPSYTERKEYRPRKSNRPSMSRVQDDSTESEGMLER